MALAFAREGADLVVSYLSEEEDARETKRLVDEAGRRCVLMPGDVADAQHCRGLVAKTVQAFVGIDVLVNKTAHQMTFNAREEISEEEWDRTFAVNISAMFYITKAAIPHMPAGSAIINTASINADSRTRGSSPMLRPRVRSRTSPPGWPRCWRKEVSVRTRWRRDRFGRR